MVKSKSTDEKLSDFICVYLLMNTINTTLANVFGISSTAIRLVIIVIMIVLFIRCLHGMKTHTLVFFGVGYGLCIVAFLYSFLVGASISAIGTWAVTLLTVCLPLGISAYAISDKQVLYNKMLKFSYAILIVNAVNMFGNVEDSYDMHFSYCMLFVFMIHFNEFVSRRKVVFLILAIVELLMIVVHGSRGAIVCIGVFLVITILKKRMELKKKIIYLITIGVIAAIFSLFLNTLCTLLMNFLSSKGISSRTLELFFSGSFWSYKSSRGRVWEKASELISQKPWLGWGIGGSTDSFKSYSVMYPHNLFLDLFLAFGIILGVILIIVLIVLVIRAFCAKNTAESQLSVIFMSIALVSLMFSGTIFNNYYFFIMLGVIASVNKYRVYEAENYNVLLE